MSVLESMRSGSDSTFMQVVLALVVVSFVFWYAVPQGEQSQVVATVNGTKIMDTSYRREYRNALREAEARYQRTLSNEEQAAIGEQVRQKLIEDEVVLQEAEDLGIEVSDTEIARYIVEQPFLHNEEGKFDKSLLERHLKRLQMTRPDFEDLIRKQMMREKLRLLVYTGASVSEPEIKKAWVDQNTMVDVKYVKVRARDFSDDVEVTPEQIDQYVLENEPELQARYERDKNRLYNLPERFTVRMIRVPVTEELPIDQAMAKVNTVREQVEAGAEFGELAKESSSDPSAANGGLLEPKPLAQFSSEEAAAIGALEVGGLTHAVANASGTDVRLFQLDAKLPAEEKSFEDVKAEIAEAMLREEGGPALAAAFAEEELLPAWKEAGEPPQDLLDENNIPPAQTTGEVPVITQPGNFFLPPPDMLQDARTIEPGSVFGEVYESAGTLWVGQLVVRKDPNEGMYDLEKEKLAEPVLAMKRNEFFTGWVGDAKARATIK